MAITRREILGQLDRLVQAESRVMSSSADILPAELDIDGFTDEFEEDGPRLSDPPIPSSIPGATPFRRQ